MRALCFFVIPSMVLIFSHSLFADGSAPQKEKCCFPIRDRLEINATLIEEKNGSDFEDFFAADVPMHLCKEKSSIDESIFPSRSVAVIFRRSLTGEWAVAFDDFRSLPDGGGEGNFGAFTSLNLRGDLSHDFFVQMGGSYGIYDWGGRLSTPLKNSKTMQQQMFLTGTAYRASTTPSRFHAGLAYDVMFNRHFGLFAVNPTLLQLRAQLGYLFKGGNEFGFWGTLGTGSQQKHYDNADLRFKGICQANAFWCHYFKNHSYGMLWAGTPYKRGLMYDSGRPGRYLLGTRFEVPLTRSLSVSGHASYMGARSAPSGIESRNYAADVSFALTYAFGHCRVVPTPYMIVSDNSTFLVDTNYNY